MNGLNQTEEAKRVEAARGNPNGWRLWGPYLSERAWGSVREDYSPDGSAWTYFPHDHARSRAYRWNEDGIAGISDIRQRLCFALALWNGKDPILKERCFGLTGTEGNHGEDIKEYFFHVDSTPTHSYMKYLYKYPQAEYPYADLVRENGRRNRFQPEYELLDTGVFHESRYFDVFVEYAKAAEDDICIRITVINRGPETAAITVIPTLWFRNTWSWSGDPMPNIRRAAQDAEDQRTLIATHPHLNPHTLCCEAQDATTGHPRLLFTDNNTNNERLFKSPNATPYVKDAFHRAILHGDLDAVNPMSTGTKAGIVYHREILAGGEAVFRLRLTEQKNENDPVHNIVTTDDFDSVFARRIAEADDFYHKIAPPGLSPDALMVQRRAFAGLLWSKQFYNYNVERWLDGDPLAPPPPPEHTTGRNSGWSHLNSRDILMMPDKWEYPWFAAWDLAFHMIPLAMVDTDMAKNQLILLCREWYMHPNGQLPAYEWKFDDVNPPVHAWAALRVYQIDRRMRGLSSKERGDLDFLERIFHKLLINFTWWVNRKDREGNNVFEGGFLGLDNIGVFDRSAELPTGGFIEQCDGTAWMAMYCLNLLAIALELAQWDATYQDVAVKFAEHFVYIAHALNQIGTEEMTMWNEEDGFFYDLLHLPNGKHVPLKVRSLVGLIPLFAVESFDAEVLNACPEFLQRIEWFVTNKPKLAANVAHVNDRGIAERALFSLVDEKRLRRVLEKMLDEKEFLSPYGLRSISQYHRDHPYVFHTGGGDYKVDYEPAESTTSLFGGNSNWRGPIWFPLNYLLVEALQRYDYVYGEGFKIDFPTGSGNQMTLGQVAAELSRRLTRTSLRNEEGKRPVYGGTEIFQTDPYWRDHILFFEYYHGDNGAGIGASHQTGWTALVAKLLEQSGE